nr:hypothetical protein B0A51_00438 [Rachicladosporium sp. CCFEE 5018]
MAGPPSPPPSDEKINRPPKRKCTEPDDGEGIIVLVESNQFMIHRDYVCAKSKFFQAACSARWLEGQEKTMTMEDMKAPLFRRYVYWTYHDKFDVQAPEDSSQHDHKEGLLDIYLLADRLDDIALRKHAMGLLHHHLKHTNTRYPRPAWYQRVFSGLVAGSLLRHLVVNYTIARRKRGVLDASAFPPDFINELVVAALDEIPTGKALCGDLAGYLEEVPGEKIVCRS